MSSSFDSFLTEIGLGSANAKTLKEPLLIGRGRDLGEGDLARMESGVSSAPALAKLRQSHHHLARLLAEGRKAVDVSAITGYSQSRISILQRDPAFKELLAHYASLKEVAYYDVHERLAMLGVDTITELQERMNDPSHEFSNRELFELAQMTLDRSVAPPKNGAKGGPQSGPALAAIEIKFVTPSGVEPVVTINGTVE